jgi:transglutaminase-like putative cysteine protease
MYRTLFCLLCLFISLQLSAQDEEPPDFNRVQPVSVSDFSPVSPLVTPETTAVILIDSGASILDANLQDGFFVKYYKFKRMLVLNKSVLDEAGKVSLEFSKQMNGKKLKNLRAYTYNLENGKIFREELKDNDFFYEETKSDLKTVKFSFPALKVGSIIEFEYSKRWDSDELADWNFQTDYPKLKSVYTVTLPDLFNFTIQFRNKKYLTNTTKNTTVKTVYSSNYEYLNSTITTISWTFENVPAMRTEPFTSTVENFLASVRFQLSARPHHPGVTVTVLRDWQVTCNTILSYDQFGDPTSFIKKQANQFAEGKSTELQKAEAVFNGVRDHFKITERGIFIPGDQTLNDVYKMGYGNAGAINSVLIAMLKSQKIQADPVILATRDKGITNQAYPLVENYNYLICRTEIGGKVYYLDASDANLGFGKLPLDCYNGHARVVSKKNFPVFLAPDSLRESSYIKAEISNVPGSHDMILESTNIAGYYESSDLRTELKEKTLESLIKKNTQTVPLRYQLDSFSVSDLKNLDLPVTLYYKMTLAPGNDAHLYFNPFLNYGITENPFKSAQRYYPVEMPYVLEETYEMAMDIPSGNEVEELPKSEKILLDDSTGSYEYTIVMTGNRIHLKSHLAFTQAIFEPEEYTRLKDFYAVIVRKQNEMIVFKKKN